LLLLVVSQASILIFEENRLKSINTAQLRSLYLALACLLLAGCSAAVTQQKDWSKAGPFEVNRMNELVLFDEVQQRDVILQVAWPAGEGTFPVVVFSAGAFCYPQQYSNVTDHWVSHGYIVIFPNHLDSPNGPKMKPADIPNMLSARSQDMSFVLDSLAEIENSVPELKGHIDRNRAAVAGHSFGGMIAMLKTGLKMETQEDGSTVVMADERFMAAVVMSGVGQMEPMQMFPQVPTMSVDAFAGLTKPLIASGGTLDAGNVGTGKIYPWEWRMAPFYLAPEGDKYAVILQDSDHYLGGLICRSNKGGEADPVAVEVVRAAQTAFLDAYVKQDAAALRWLQSGNFTTLSDGRATFEYK
jgi:hypothetical protein